MSSCIVLWMRSRRHAEPALILCTQETPEEQRAREIRESLEGRKEFHKHLRAEVKDKALKALAVQKLRVLKESEDPEEQVGGGGGRGGWEGACHSMAQLAGAPLDAHPTMSEAQVRG